MNRRTSKQDAEALYQTRSALYDIGAFYYRSEVREIRAIGVLLRFGARIVDCAARSLERMSEGETEVFVVRATNEVPGHTFGAARLPWRPARWMIEASTEGQEGKDGERMYTVALVGYEAP